MDNDAARVLALFRPVTDRSALPVPDPVVLPAEVASVLPTLDPPPRRGPGRPRKEPGQGKHLNLHEGGRTTGGQRIADAKILSQFSDPSGGIPSSQELLAATAQLLRRFHGQAFTEQSYHAKNAAVAFGVLVDKLTLLRSQAAQPVAAEDAEQYREGVLRLAQRIAELLAPRSAPFK